MTQTLCFFLGVFLVGAPIGMSLVKAGIVDWLDDRLMEKMRNSS
jgi:hypothetical protein